MRKLVVFVVIGVAVAAGVILYSRNNRAAPASATEPAAPRGGAFGRPPMTVELGAVGRSDLTEHLTVVGNLTGATTVDVVPKVSGRLQTVDVRIADRVRRGQRLAKVEDNEILEQVRQVAASFEVARATVRQREADAKLADTSLERARNLFSRQLISEQTLDDAEARAQAASAQLDLSRAQFEQAKARLEELQITLANTTIVSPLDGFVSRRLLDPGAFASPNAPVASVVDIDLVRLVANLVERDLHRITMGVSAMVEVDAYPGETFTGKVARISPVLDPSTRTAPIEIEVPNPSNRLKPGMYARVRLTVGERAAALVVPRNAVVDHGGLRGVFTPAQGDKTVTFVPVETGLQDDQHVEIRHGIGEGQRVVTTGAAGLRDGDPIILAGAAPGGRGAAGGGTGPGSRPDNRSRAQGGRS